MESSVTIGNGQSLTYCSHSNTIRQMPQNYLVAKKSGGVWVLDCDGAVDVKTGLMVAMSIMCDGVKFRDGNGVIDGITDNFNLYTIDVDRK